MPKKRGDTTEYWLDRVEADLDSAKANLKDSEHKVAKYHLDLLIKAAEHAIDTLVDDDWT